MSVHSLPPSSGLDNVTVLNHDGVTGDNTGTVKVTPDQCGIVFLGDKLSAQAANKGFNVLLPPIQAGLRYKFILRNDISNNATAAITVKSTSNGTTPADLIVGTVVQDVTVDGGGEKAIVLQKAAVHGIITFVHNKAKTGDNVELVCDGSNWYINGVSTTEAGITFSNV